IRFVEIRIDLPEEHLNHAFIGVLPGEVQKYREGIVGLLCTGEENGLDVSSLSIRGILGELDGPIVVLLGFVRSCGSRDKKVIAEREIWIGLNCFLCQSI